MHPQSSARNFPFTHIPHPTPVTYPAVRVLTKNTDLLDRLVNEPMSQQECGQVLGYYMMHVAAMSPAIEDGAYANARRELSALLQHDLDPIYFRDAAVVGWQIHCRTADYPLADGYEMWSDLMLANEMAWCITCLVEGIDR